MAPAARLTMGRLAAVIAAAVVLHAAPLATAADLDPYAQAVVDSVAHPAPVTAAEVLSAALKTADVEAADAAIAYARQLADLLTEAGERRADLLAMLGDEASPGSLLRLESILASREPDLLPVVEAIAVTGRQRRRDPARIAKAADDLRSPSAATRLAATTTLGRAGLAALPALAGILESEDGEGGRAREIARGLVRDLGEEGKHALLAHLGSAEVRSWPGVIAGLDATEADDVAEFLLAPATVPDTPPAIRDLAIAALRRIDDRRRGPIDSWRPPSRDEAVAGIMHRLDLALAPQAIHDDRSEHADDAAGRRVRDALHLARDLTALGVTEPAAVRLVLLARLTALVTLPRAPSSAHPDAGQLAAALAGPDGLDLEAAADTLDLAVSRGLLPAAAAAARGIEEAVLPPDQPLDLPAAPLPPAVRRALVRALMVPDAALQFAAARALALTAAPPPWPGSSRVIGTLVHASTATGIDRVVVAHHDAEIAQQISTGVSRFGYRPITVSTGRGAVVAAREHADTVLVILGARIILPSAFETVQFIQEQPFGDIPPVLVVIDPFDDAPRGRFLTKSIFAFSRLECVSLVDRMESFFLPTREEGTGRELAPARFPAALAECAGPDAVAAEARAARAALRRERATQAATLLRILHRRGWEIPADACAGLGISSADRDPTGYNRSATSPTPPPFIDAASPEPTE